MKRLINEGSCAAWDASSSVMDKSSLIGTSIFVCEEVASIHVEVKVDDGEHGSRHDQDLRR